MRQKKSIIRILLPWVIALAALAALVFFVFVPIYSQKDTSFGEQPYVIFYEGDGKTLSMENDQLLFELDAGTTYFTVTDKASGKVWHSNPENRDSDPIAMSLNKDLLSSTFVITYSNAKGDVDLNNYTYSIKDKSYNVTKEEDGSILVDYAIGKIEREFMIPNAITEERYEKFTGAMKTRTKKIVTSNYTKYEPSKLNSKSNKDEIIALYPSVLEQTLYILKSDTKTNNKVKIEAAFEEGGYNAEEWAIDRELEAGKRDNNGPIFNVKVRYKLDGPDLLVEIPYSEIRCSDDSPLTYLSVLPFFGCGNSTQEGFMLVPEGGGALINFNNGKVSQSTYYANLYGWDYAVYRSEAVSETRDCFPVFGISQEDGSFICMIEGASSYAGITADVAGKFNSYNFVYSKYNVLHADQFNVSGRTAQLVYMYEKSIPTDTLIQRYRFMQENSYVSMAEAYGDYLKNHEMIAESKPSEEVPVNVELVGAVDKVQVKLGMPVDSILPTTTFEEAKGIVQELSDSGIKNLNVRMTGWMNGGVRQRVATSVHTLGELGGDGKLKDLVAAAKEKNVNLYLDGLNCFAYDSGLLNGFLPFTHAARYATREQVKLNKYDIVTYQQADWLDTFYLVRPEYAKANASNLIKAVKDRGAAGVAFRDIGKLLSADYYQNDTITREQAKEMNVETLKEARENGLKVSIKEGNEYALPYADLVTDMDLTGNDYAMLDASIPFYQIALHGLKDYTGPSINLAGNYTTALLECAEYGAGLNFTFMKADTSVLQESHYSCYTSSGYDLWKDQVTEMILRYQQEMAGLNSRKITDHRRINSEVSETTYDDGTKVYVNYGFTDFKTGGKKIPARDYLVERGSGK